MALDIVLFPTMFQGFIRSGGLSQFLAHRNNRGLALLQNVGFMNPYPTTACYFSPSNGSH